MSTNDFVNQTQEAQIAAARKGKKTNAVWYPFGDLGAYFKIEKGELLGCYMNTDGTREDEPFDVDLYHINDEEKQSLKAVYQVLIGQP